TGCRHAAGTRYAADLRAVRCDSPGGPALSPGEGVQPEELTNRLVRSRRSLRRRLFAGKSEFSLPWTVQMDDLPVAFGDALRVKGSSCSYLPCDGQRGHTDAVRFQVSAEHCRGRPESRLAQGNGRKGRNRVVGEPAPGDEDGPEARSPHGRGGHLRDDDGADDIYGIRRLQVGDTRAQQPVWSSQDGVVDDDARCVMSEVELPHSGAQ